jgi:hypothetical protein
MPLIQVRVRARVMAIVRVRKIRMIDMEREGHASYSGIDA